jgi:hypothetical protein
MLLVVISNPARENKLAELESSDPIFQRFSTPPNADVVLRGK